MAVNAYPSSGLSTGMSLSQVVGGGWFLYKGVSPATLAQLRCIPLLWMKRWVPWGGIWWLAFGMRRRHMTAPRK